MEGKQEEVIQICEHESLGEDISRRLSEAGFVPADTGYMGAPRLLGIDYDESRNLRASYYIGACHLPAHLGQLVVLPKISNLNFLAMLAVCVSHIPSAEYFSKCYGVSLNEAPIDNARCYDIITPLLALHYISLLEKLVKRGLAKDYISRQENLNCKIKGRVDILADWKHNIANSRRERVYCRFQEYSEDIPVNRLLKKAFKIADNSLQKILRLPAGISLPYRNGKRIIDDGLKNVSDVINVRTVIPKRNNKLNPYYPEALKLAREIIRHQESNIKRGKNSRKSVPPFWIDLSRLFEVYVLALLQKEYGSQIEFQVRGHRAVADYIHRSEHIVIDAKYKTIYLGDDFDINDIREISGNARDNKICSRFIGWSGEEPSCLIIYPDEHGINHFEGSLLRIENKQDLLQFRKFYKIGVSLPEISKEV